jgi:carotenoid 1,2-hydratase
LNVALYGNRKRWALTERGRGDLERSAAALRLGPSSLSWEADALTFRIDEVTAPLPSRIRGQVRLYPTAIAACLLALDAEGRHHWQPIAPRAQVEVELDQPGLRWTGVGYLDSNRGDAPIEQAFKGWHWSRSCLAGGDTVVLYDVARRAGDECNLALRFDARGGCHDFAAPPRVSLPRTLWGIARATRAEVGKSAPVIQTMEDTPFYARSMLSTRLFGEPVTAVHESLDLDRFRTPWVRALLPFRMPRMARR